MLKSAFMMQYKFVHLQSNDKRHSIMASRVYKFVCLQKIDKRCTNLYTIFPTQDKEVNKFVHLVILIGRLRCYVP